MKLLLQSIHLKNYSIRTEIHQGRDYLVVPVVMLVEGVHDSINSGLTMHLAEEFSKLPEAWDGVPVTVNHPQNTDGSYISANTPQIIDDQTVGIIYNTKIENNKLKAEAWIEKDKTKKLYPELIKTLINGTPLNISTGVFNDPENSSGEYAGERYESIARNYMPNHLALLPNDIGACSWLDGCGVRVNKDGGDKLKKNTIAAMKTLAKEGFSVNQLGFRETSSKIQTKLDGMDTDVKLHNLQEVFDDEFVYSVFGSNDEQLLKRGYRINTDETIEFTGEPVPVIRKVEFTEITANKEKGVNAMSKEKSKSCCPAKVQLLVQSGRFDENDKEWLDDLKELALDKLLSDKERLQVNREDAIKVLKDDLGTPDKLIALLSGDTKSIVEHGLALNQEERKKLIEHISVNTGGEGGYTNEELNAKETEELKKLAILVKQPSNYSGINSGVINVNAENNEMLLPLSRKPSQETTQ